MISDKFVTTVVIKFCFHLQAPSDLGSLVLQNVASVTHRRRTLRRANVAGEMAYALTNQRKYGLVVIKEQHIGPDSYA
jgi:hypothetical protein